MQSIHLDADSSKGSSKEPAKALGVSLNHIDNYPSYEERTLLIVNTTNYGGGGVEESFAS